MKIAFLLQSFPCLSETFILNQITGLIDLGCDIRIIAFNKSKDKKQHADVQKYKLLDRTTYINVSGSKTAKRTGAAVNTITTFMRHPRQVYRLQKKLLKSYPSYSYPKLFMALALIGGKFDIIHCHYGMVGNEVLFVKDAGLKAKISTVFHGYDISSYLKIHGSGVYKELFNKGDIFLPVSEFWKKRLLSLGCPAEKIIVNHMGVDMDKFSPKKKELPENKIKVLTVARLTEKKGHCYALQAISQAVLAIPNLEYHIAGDGPLLKELKNITLKLGIENHVIFHGNVDAGEVLELYKDADIFLLPSVTSSTGDMEGIPVVLMEAMACGLPVIASDHSGIPELVIDGKTGYIIPERDSEAIKNSIVHLTESPETGGHLAGHGREYVIKFFNNKVLCNKLLLHLECVTSKSV